MFIMDPSAIRLAIERGWVSAVEGESMKNPPTDQTDEQRALLDKLRNRVQGRLMMAERPNRKLSRRGAPERMEPQHPYPCIDRPDISS